MKLSLSWLADYVEFTETNSETIAQILTEKSAEVDDVLSSLDALKTVVTGKLLRFEKIDGSDKLHNGTFDLGEYGEKTVVFGQVFSLIEGEIYPIAMSGTTLPGGLEVKKAKMRGVESQGMVCSDAELGIQYSEEGFFRFPQNAPLGTPIIEYMKASLEHVVVGEILEITKHPDADTLSVTKVNVGDAEPLQIICGGSNLKVGAKVPISKVGANLWNQIKIKKAKMRGVESQGMICSTEELRVGPSQNKEIMILENDAPIGQSFFSYMIDEEHILDVENTTITNRPDLFSHIGFAREIVACGLGSMRSVPPMPASEGTQDMEKIVTIDDPETICPRYMAVSITGVDGSKKSPEWMQRRLEACGVRPLNALIDITNYVMLEYGTPTHAFDADRIGTKLHKRLSLPGEKATTLDGIERELPENTIVFADENGIFDICGIMGGENSAIRDETQNLYLHTVLYDPVLVRRSSVAMGHRTDASIIFEKGVPPTALEPSIRRSIALVLEIFPEATVRSKILDIKNYEEKETIIDFDPKLADRIIGSQIPVAEMTQILETLGFQVQPHGDVLSCTVPSWRVKDINIPEDIAEEIVRIYGLNRVEMSAPTIEMALKPQIPHRELEKNIARVLVDNGCHEIVTLNFLGEKLLSRCGVETQHAASSLPLSQRGTEGDLKNIEKISPNPSLQKRGTNHITIKNPLSEDLSIMRSSLSPRLLETAEKNRRYRKKFRLFESGKVFSLQKGQKKEEHRLTALLVGDDFLTAKSLAQSIIREQDWKYRICPIQPPPPFAHPARHAIFQIGKSGGIKVFEIHPKVATEFGLPKQTSIVCLTIAPLSKIPQKNRKITPLPRFQEIPFDFSVLCDRKILVGDLLKGLEKLDERIFSSTVMDVFEGTGVPDGQKSVTLSFEFRASDRTLTDEERDEIFQILLKKLEERGAKFRFGE